MLRHRRLSVSIACLSTRVSNSTYCGFIYNDNHHPPVRETWKIGLMKLTRSEVEQMNANQRIQEITDLLRFLRNSFSLKFIILHFCRIVNFKWEYLCLLQPDIINPEESEDSYLEFAVEHH